MRVLVTGATGYVGYAVCAALLDAGHDVTGFSRSSEVSPLGIEMRAGYIADESAMATAMLGVDAVCHLAAVATARESVAEPAMYYRTNVVGTLNVLNGLVMASSGPRLVFASTSAVYGAPSQQPIAECAPAAPLNPYGSTKVAAEQAIRWYANAGLIGATTLRLFNAAGAIGSHGDTELSRVLPKAVAVAAGLASHIDVNGDGSAVRDFVHIADIADAFVRALDYAPPGGIATYNVGATRASVADIIAATERVTGRKVAVNHRAANPNEAPELVADTTAIRTDMGWEPKRSGLDEIVADQWRSLPA
jgi:UDP-glucose 4-epimerase